MSADLACWNIADLRRKAEARLPRGVWEYLERGVEDETGMGRNRAALDALTFVPRVARNVEQIDLSASLLGEQSALPFAIGPTGAAGLIHYNGDIALARAARAAGIPFTISSASTLNLEQIVAEAGRVCFQLYLWENRELSFDVVRRAQAAGCDTLFVTLDLPVPPNREYLSRNGFGIPFKPNRQNVADVLMHPRWLLGVIGQYMLREGKLPQQANLPPHLRHSIGKGGMPGAQFKQDNLDWDGIAELRDMWRGKMVVKGVLHPDDAVLAARYGLDAVIVSNHGGRALDYSIAAIDALPAVLDAAGERLDVWYDSGIRRGSDIAKALALGAKGVLIGRATLYGLAAGGEVGVARAIALLEQELRRTMAYLGVTSIEGLDRSVFSPARV
ncbi:alpha-hydroxy acid oxidase [Aurantiacibacter suaedae]|uniref:alpha-hydroxy acid oxidase n=1 Tax=Aurantiacibacter suaedae TaxID=2545755 RepID=UPI0010F72523|nr:alpha-hydroxy acid oxidase [Aurantiacibacter suaedae]